MKILPQYLSLRSRFYSWLCLGLLLSLLTTIGSGLLPNHFHPHTASAQTVPAEFSQGQQAYEQQDYAAAITLWQSLLSATNQPDQQVALLNNIALAQQAQRQWSEAQQTIQRSLSLLGWTESSAIDTPYPALLAQSLDIYGQWLYYQSDAETALLTWHQAEEYHSLSDSRTLEAIAHNQLNQAQALQYLGRYLDSQAQLQHLYEMLASFPDSVPATTAIDVRLSLGRILRLVGNLNDGDTGPNARDVLQDALALARTVGSDRLSAIHLELGNTYRVLTERARSLEALSGGREAISLGIEATQAATDTLDHYRQAIETAPNRHQRIQAQLNQLSFYIRSATDRSVIPNLVSTLQSELAQLPSDPSSLQLRLAFTSHALTLAQEQPLYAPSGLTLAELLATTATAAKTRDDARIEAETWGLLGHLYEVMGQSSDLEDALQSTHQALSILVNVELPELNYRLQWQLGRILKQQGKTEQAISAYEATVKTIQSLRRELVILNPDVQFSFRKDIEPVYREFADLLLKDAQPSQAHLKKARKTIDSLQTLEVENYLRQSCSNSTLEEIDQLIAERDPTAAFLYTIILRDRLEVIVKLPGQADLAHHRTAIQPDEVNSTIDRLRGEVESPDSIQYYAGFSDLGKQLSEQVFNWLVRPISPTLESKQIQNLVFVLDGVLRDVPLATLFDGEKFLIEQDYATVLSPGLQLLQPTLSDHEDAGVLAFALSTMRDGFQPHQGWADLPYVDTEIEEIEAIRAAQSFSNEKFTLDQFQQEVIYNPAAILHIATHAKFEPRLEESFILAWDGPISLRTLGDLLRPRDITLEQPIQLAVLSACETAAGDGQASLGLAGFSVQSGVRTALASLWAVNDESTSQLMGYFYEALSNPQNSQATSLKIAQTRLLRDNYLPHYWGAFTMIGNWL